MVAYSSGMDQNLLLKHQITIKEIGQMNENMAENMAQKLFSKSKSRSLNAAH